MDEAKEDDGNEADVETSGTATETNGDASGDKKSKKVKDHEGRIKKEEEVKGDKEQDKEWAKYVFVQQLRLQQQHNDEINRVKPYGNKNDKFELKCIKKWLLN